ncbi:MAG: 6-phosphogluconolactonase [Nanoarchaeota archaeon]
MITTISGSKQKDDEKVVEIIEKSLARILRRKPAAVLGLPGGRSVQGIFRLLAKNDTNDTGRTHFIPWNRVQLFWVDERLVPLDHAESNYRLAKELFLDELVKKNKIPKENIHPFDYKAGVLDYQKTLARYGGRYDLILLGVGEDGHIAGLFPHHPGLKKKNAFFTMNDAPKLPGQRMSIGSGLLQKAEVAIALFYGKEKEEAWKAFRNPALGVEDCPAKLILPIREAYAVIDL